MKSEDNQIAYLVSTGFMTILPLLAIAGAVWLLRRRVKELSRPPMRTADGRPLRVVGARGD